MSKVLDQNFRLENLLRVPPGDQYSRAAGVLVVADGEIAVIQVMGARGGRNGEDQQQSENDPAHRVFP